VSEHVLNSGAKF